MKRSRVLPGVYRPQFNAQKPPRRSARIALIILAAAFVFGGIVFLSGCSNYRVPDNVSEVGARFGGGYTDPTTGETYNGSVDNYVKFKDGTTAPKSAAPAAGPAGAGTP